MRIAFVIHDGTNYRGGPTVNARRLLPELAARGHEPVAIVNYRGDAPNADALEAAGVQCIRQGWPAFTEDRVSATLRTLADIDADIFVPNHDVAAFWAARWAREAGIPTIATHRSDHVFYWAAVEQFVTGPRKWAVSAMVCVSRGIHDRIAATSPANTRLAVIPSGVPVPDEADLPPQRSPCFIAYVGRLEEHLKRIGRLFDIVLHVLDAIPEGKAVFIGDGKERGTLEAKAAAHSAGARMRFTGNVNPQQVQRELADSGVVLLLSDAEGMPGAMMDAMACRLVPIGTDVNGINELISHGETGLLVEPTADAVLTAIKSLQADPSLFDRMGRAARSRIEADYSLASAADRWEHLCDQLIAEARDACPKRPINIPARIRLPRGPRDLGIEDVHRDQPLRRLRFALRGWLQR